MGGRIREGVYINVHTAGLVKMGQSVTVSVPGNGSIRAIAQTDISRQNGLQLVVDRTGTAHVFDPNARRGSFRRQQQYARFTPQIEAEEEILAAFVQGVSTGLQPGFYNHILDPRYRVKRVENKFIEVGRILASKGDRLIGLTGGLIYASPDKGISWNLLMEGITTTGSNVFFRGSSNLNYFFVWQYDAIELEWNGDFYSYIHSKFYRGDGVNSWEQVFESIDHESTLSNRSIGRIVGVGDSVAIAWASRGTAPEIAQYRPRVTVSNDDGQTWTDTIFPPEPLVNDLYSVSRGCDVAYHPSLGQWILTTIREVIFPAVPAQNLPYYLSEDHGQSWSPQEFPDTVSSPKAYIEAGKNVWMGGPNLFSGDGLSWLPMAFDQPVAQFRSFYNSTADFYLGFPTRIIKGSDENIPTDFMTSRNGLSWKTASFQGGAGKPYALEFPDPLFWPYF